MEIVRYGAREGMAVLFNKSAGYVGFIYGQARAHPDPGHDYTAGRAFGSGRGVRAAVFINHGYPGHPFATMPGPTTQYIDYKVEFNPYS